MTARLSLLVFLLASCFEVHGQQKPGVATVRSVDRDPETFWQSPNGPPAIPRGFQTLEEQAQSSHPREIQSRLTLTADQLMAAGLSEEANALRQLARRIQEQHFERLLAQHNEALAAARKSQIGLHVQTIEYVPSPEMDAAIRRLLKQFENQSETGKSLDETQSKPNLQGTLPAAELKTWIDELTRAGQLKVLSDLNLTVLDGRNTRFAGNNVPLPGESTSRSGAVSNSADSDGVGQVLLTTTARVLRDHIIRIGLILDYQEVHEKTGIDTRRLQTVVEVMEGQSMVSSGLERTRNVAEVTRVPVLGDVPIIGSRLFSRKKMVPVKSELLFVITPEIIAPLDMNWPSDIRREDRSPIQPTKHTLPPK